MYNFCWYEGKYFRKIVKFFLNAQVCEIFLNAQVPNKAAQVDIFFQKQLKHMGVY